MDKVLVRIHEDLGIQERHLKDNRLSFHQQPPVADLRVVDFDFEGKPFVLISETARAWVRMRQSALEDGVALLPFSGFRSYAHQKILIERHLKNGRRIEDILTHIAIPGFSEHHSGRAIDIHAEGKPVLEEDFELTDAFAWLVENAKQFEFRLSYPKGNSLGIIYEPWHWFYTGH